MGARVGLQRKRRIFSSGSRRSRQSGAPLPRTVLVGLFGAVCIAGMVIVAMPSVLFGRVPAVSGVVMADAPQVAVVDGSTLRLRDTVVRLAGLDAPARRQICADGPAQFDCGTASAQALAGIVRGHSVTCQLSGRDPAGYLEASCEAAGTELNRAMVAAGWARARSGDSGLTAAQDTARTRRLGLWRDGATGLAF